MEKMQLRADGPPPQKEPYEPPKATFVPLRMEERLMAGSCGQGPAGIGACTTSPYAA